MVTADALPSTIEELQSKEPAEFVAVEVDELSFASPDAVHSAEAILSQARSSGVTCLHLVKWGPLGNLGKPTWVRLHVSGRASAVAWVLRELHALRRKERSAR